VSIHEKVKADVGQLKFLCEAGHFFASKGRFAEACDIFEGVIALAPERAIGYTLLGDAYLNMEKYDEAIKTHQRALEVEPDNTFARVHLGEAFLFKKQKEKGLSELRRVMEQDPNSPDAELARHWIKASEQGVFTKL
jgi:tetratricopeptide (TPR) repeat protein